MTSSIFSHSEELADRAELNLQDLKDTLGRKLEAIKQLSQGRSEESRARLKAKCEGIELALAIVEESATPFIAYWTMSERLPTIAPEHRQGFDIALQDARLIAML